MDVSGELQLLFQCLSCEATEFLLGHKTVTSLNLLAFPTKLSLRIGLDGSQDHSMLKLEDTSEIFWFT